MIFVSRCLYAPHASDPPGVQFSPCRALMSPWEGHTQNVLQKDSSRMAACPSWGRSGRNVAGGTSQQQAGRGAQGCSQENWGQTPEQALAAGPPAHLLPGTQGSGGAGRAPNHLSHLSGPPTAGDIKASAPRPRALRKLGISRGLFRLLVPLLQAGGTPITSPHAPQWRPAAAPGGARFCSWPVLEEGAPCGDRPGQDTSHPVSLCP